MAADDPSAAPRGQDTSEGLVQPDMLTDDHRLSAEPPPPAGPEDLLGTPPRGAEPPPRDEDVQGEAPPEAERVRREAPGQEFSAGEA